MVVFTSLYIFIDLLFFQYWYKKNKQDSIFKLSIVLFLPVVGYILLTMLYIRRNFFHNKIKTVHGFRNEKSTDGLSAPVNISEATKLIPIEEALSINNSKIKRTTLLELLKNGEGRHPDLLKIALSDEDTETSHYAAVGIVEFKRKLQKSYQEYKDKYDMEKNNYITIKYAHTLKDYLDSGFLDKSTKESLEADYQDLLKKLLEFHEIEETFFIDCINREIEIGRFKTAAFYCNKYHNAHPHSDKTYLMYLKLYYSMGDKDRFKHIIDSLKESLIVPCNDIWDIVKLWAEG